MDKKQTNNYENRLEKQFMNSLYQVAFNLISLIIIILKNLKK